MSQQLLQHLQGLLTRLPGPFQGALPTLKLLQRLTAQLHQLLQQLLAALQGLLQQGQITQQLPCQLLHQGQMTQPRQLLALRA